MKNGEILDRHYLNVAVAICLALMLILAGCAQGDAPGFQKTVAQNAAAPSSAAPSSAAPASPLPASAGLSYADVVARVSPAVVTILSERRVRAPQQHPFMDDPLLRDFFGGLIPRAQPQQDRRLAGLGSGVIVSGDGYVLTNHHVIDGAEAIKVVLAGNRSITPKVIGSDPPSDLAVLRIEGRNLPVLNPGDSDRVRIGDVALAIGNPLGLGQTVTMGIISAKGRYTGVSDGSFEDFLQTDAPINSGNSGGALVNAAGELIGINSQILSPSGGNIGIGFAIPSNMARNVMDQLTRTGSVRRGRLGIAIEPLTSETASKAGLSEPHGVLVRGVERGSAGEKAGLREGDVITALNGVPVSDSNTLRNQVAGNQPGTEVRLTVARNGREMQLKARLDEFVTRVEPRRRDVR